MTAGEEPAGHTDRPRVILAVCLGNICRSPTAEAALREAALAAGLPLNVRSAGTGDWHIGAPPDARMRAAAAAEGLELTGTGAQVDAAALAAADLVLAMDASNLRDLRALATDAGIDTPMRLFRAFDPDANGDPTQLDVPDPYHGGPEGFTDVVRMVRRTARALVAELLADRI